MVTVFVKNESSNVEHWALVCSLQEMQDDQQKQLKDMKENIGYYQKKAQELEVRCKERYNTYMCTLYRINVYRHVINIVSTVSAFYLLVILFYINLLQLQLNISVARSIIIHGRLTVANFE